MKDNDVYKQFDRLDGSHPWQEQVPRGFVLYPARQIAKANVTYFNFDLAMQMGLIPTNHPKKMNPELEQKILQTFALQIINEYDQLYRPATMTKAIPNKRFMATRYLQIQHANKAGKTSGDGRCIWNGVIEHQGKTWDVSSRGTGVTCLAPGAVQNGKPLKTGNDEVGYGCGLADMDELFAATMMSEVFHHQNIPTERMLCIVDLGKGYGIGVRAGQNLIRPAHIFLYLKQKDSLHLLRSLRYLIDRQYKNKRWNFSSRHPNALQLMLLVITDSFAKFAATLDVDYIFTWLEWDGDNVLADAGIIDYGSIRQFGLRHDQYRYDDVSRFSTNLNEQKNKARMTVQAFIQAVDFLSTGRKRALKRFDRHKLLKKFDQLFERYRSERILYRTGFTAWEIKRLFESQPSLVQSFVKSYRRLESFKSRRRLHRVPDGVNRPALFNLRRLLRMLPQQILNDPHQLWIPEAELFKVLLKKRARGKDRLMTRDQRQCLDQFQKLYRQMIVACSGSRNYLRILRQIAQRSALINRPDRMTGNSVTVCVADLMEKVGTGKSQYDLTQEILTAFIQSQILMPGKGVSDSQVVLNAAKEPEKEILGSLFQIVGGLSEEI